MSLFEVAVRCKFSKESTGILNHHFEGREQQVDLTGVRRLNPLLNRANKYRQMTWFRSNQSLGGDAVVKGRNLARVIANEVMKPCDDCLSRIAHMDNETNRAFTQNPKIHWRGI